MLDGRTKEARLMQSVRQELSAHVGGKPNAAARSLIERAANLSVRLALMDERFAETRVQTDHDSRTYLAWSNSLVRTIRALGLQEAAQRPPSLQELMAATRAQTAA